MVSRRTRGNTWKSGKNVLSSFPQSECSEGPKLLRLPFCEVGKLVVWRLRWVCWESARELATLATDRQIEQLAI